MAKWFFFFLCLLTILNLSSFFSLNFSLCSVLLLLQSKRKRYRDEVKFNGMDATKLVGLKFFWFRFSFCPFNLCSFFCFVRLLRRFISPRCLSLFFLVLMMHFNSITRCMIIILHRCTGLRPVFFFFSFGWSFILARFDCSPAHYLIAILCLIFFF